MSRGYRGRLPVDWIAFFFKNDRPRLLNVELCPFNPVGKIRVEESNVGEGSSRADGVGADRRRRISKLCCKSSEQLYSITVVWLPLRPRDCWRGRKALRAAPQHRANDSLENLELRLRIQVLSKAASLIAELVRRRFTIRANSRFDLRLDDVPGQALETNNRSAATRLQ